MIPIRNRKKTLEVTMEEMRNFSFAYIEKYAPSKQQLRTYLLKKYLVLSELEIVGFPECFLSTLQNMGIKFLHDAENFHQGEVLFVQAPYDFFHAAEMHFMQL